MLYVLLIAYYKVMYFTSIATSQSLLNSFRDDVDCERDSETVPLPKGEEIQTTTQASPNHQLGNLAQQKKNQPARHSFIWKKGILCAALSITTVIMVVAVTLPILFYFLFVGEVSIKNDIQYSLHMNTQKKGYCES